jgi:kynurenine 3-monooxygenase
MTLPGQAVRIVGAGMAGSLLALMLARRGFNVSLFDRRPDPRYAPPERGRSINLALAARGIRALEYAGVMKHVRPLLIEMRGRCVHDRSGDTTLLPYGWKPGEVIYSVGRAALTKMLVEEAARFPNVTLNFGERCMEAGERGNVLRFRKDESGETYDVPLSHVIATDGAGSVIRAGLAAEGAIASREELLDHDYKELTLPPVDGKPVLDPNALHIWPRGGFMLIALPNTDGSFTATLFLARGAKGRGSPADAHSSSSRGSAPSGSPTDAFPAEPGGGSRPAPDGSSAADARDGSPAASTFAGLDSPAAVAAFFEREFPDAMPLIPNLLTEFFEHPQGQLGTVHAAPWHVGNKVLLMGDAAHAIVPFHGQGMNAAFEDCLVFDTLCDTHRDWHDLFEEFDRQRRPNAEAIAQMALENYTEMRDTVLDPRFQRFKLMSVELEKRFPDRFIPRYSMVMFHPEIPYAEALRRGRIQQDILAELDTGDPTSIDFDRARTLIHERLSPVV